MSETSALAQFVAKLERRGSLAPDDRAAILALPGVHQNYAANETIVAEGVPATHCCFMESGFVSRVKRLGDGARQIVAFHIPGDGVDLQSLLFSTTDHAMRSHKPTRVYWVAHDDILTLSAQRQGVARAFWQDTLIDSSIFREWTANIGQRKARERIAHLFLELGARFEAIGMLKDETFELPVNQNALAQALGLSLVHLNKSLQALRHEGYISTRHSVTLCRKSDLVSLTGFDQNYLHLDGSTLKAAIKASAISSAEPALDQQFES